TIKYVNEDSLNIREGAGTSYKILGTYNHGDEVKVVSIDGNWAKIQYKDGYAYISNKYLSNEKPVKVTIKYVKADTLNIREGAGTSYKILGTYKKGQEVKVVSIDGDWAKINMKMDMHISQINI
ncbi:MAG: SH3 domain-containing protein, partial [Intestinibacter bartlettii]